MMSTRVFVSYIWAAIENERKRLLWTNAGLGDRVFVSFWWCDDEKHENVERLDYLFKIIIISFLVFFLLHLIPPTIYGFWWNLEDRNGIKIKRRKKCADDCVCLHVLFGTSGPKCFLELGSIVSQWYSDMYLFNLTSNVCNVNVAEGWFLWSSYFLHQEAFLATAIYTQSWCTLC